MFRQQSVELSNKAGFVVTGVGFVQEFVGGFGTQPLPGGFPSRKGLSPTVYFYQGIPCGTNGFGIEFPYFYGIKLFRKRSKYVQRLPKAIVSAGD
jgi:hypothetical protein